jgi:hypothetical protein
MGVRRRTRRRPSSKRRHQSACATLSAKTLIGSAHSTNSFQMYCQSWWMLVGYNEPNQATWFMSAYAALFLLDSFWNSSALKL